MTAQTRERPAPAGRPFAERITNAPDTPEGTTLIDPQVIAGRAIQRYGIDLAHRIFTQGLRLTTYIESGATTGDLRFIPQENRDAATRGAARCREAIAEVRQRMEVAA